MTRQRLRGRNPFFMPIVTLILLALLAGALAIYFVLLPQQAAQQALGACQADLVARAWSAARQNCATAVALAPRDAAARSGLADAQDAYYQGLFAQAHNHVAVGAAATALPLLEELVAAGFADAIPARATAIVLLNGLPATPAPIPPTPVPTLEPTATWTSSATQTPTPEPTPTYPPTRTPTATPQPTATWTPTATPQPTATWTPTETPTSKPEPTTTQTPTRTRTHTPQPTATWTPSRTPTSPPTPRPAIAKVRGNSLELHAGPGTTYITVRRAGRGDEFVITGRDANCVWFRVVTPDGTQAWLLGPPLTRLDRPCEAIPLAPIPPTPTPTKTPTPTRTSTPSPTPTPRLAIAKVRGNSLELHAGPGTTYTTVRRAGRGDEFAITGRDANCVWFRVVTPEGTQAWLLGPPLTRIDRPCEAIPLAPIPPAPTPTKTPTPTRTSTPSPTPTPRPAIAKVRGSSLELHTGPGTTYTTLGRAVRGDEFVITGRDANCVWFRVVTPDGTQAWLLGPPLTRLDRSCEAIPLAPIPPTPTPTKTSD